MLRRPLAILALLFCTTPVHAADKLFPPDAVINVTLPPYNAKPDDGMDDTQAIQQAISDHVDTGRTIYFPAGVYDIRDSLVWKNREGRWRPHLTLQGQSRDKTILRLAPRSPGFDDPDKPKAMIVTGSFWQPGDAEDGGGNKAFRNNLFDLTIQIGPNNPGAIGIEWAVSNVGSIENVAIYGPNEGGYGVAGISMRRRIPGPGLIKNVLVSGFAVGLDIADIQYGVTVERGTFANTHLAPIRVTDNLVHYADLDLPQGSAITTAGRHAVVTKAPDGAEPILIAREPTPQYWNADLSDWIAVGPRQPDERDDTQAIQRAIDAGKSTVYFVNDRAYHLSDTLILRGKVKQILGMGAQITLGAAQEPFSNIENPRPLIRIDETEHRSEVFIENVFFNAQYPGEVIFENNSPATLVLRHCGGWVGASGFRRSYRNTPRSFGGKVFIEDCFLPGWRFEKQRVWARQFNPENYDGDGSTPQVENVGGDLWVLGFKTEGPAPFIVTRAGGRTELLGAYNYISATHAPRVPEDAIPYVVDNASAHLAFVTDNFRRDSDYRIYIRATHGQTTREWSASTLTPRNGNPNDPCYTVLLLQILPPSTP